jgi:hypothetical protein
MREDLKPFCISVTTPARTFYFALKSDEELYAWMDEIYGRSPLMGVSNPTNFVHQVHVGFDPISGAFTGLPEQWTRLLTSSAITKEDYAKNPQAVLDVLEFYTDIQKRERDEFGLGTPGMGMTDVSASLANSVDSRSAPVAPVRFGAGTGLAGQVQQVDRRSPHSSPQLGGLGSSSSVPPAGSYPNASTTLSHPSSSSSRVSLPRPSPPPQLHSRPPLIPGRSAPSVPSHPRPPPAPPTSSNGLRPLLTGSASRSHLQSSGGPAATRPPPSDKPSGVKPMQLPAPQPPTSKSAGGANGVAGKIAAPAPPNKAVQALKKTEKGEGDRRISTMSESQIMTKLRSVCSNTDPNALYSKIKKVGQGASGSVFVAKVLADGSKVAIKQMDLSHQPRKELIVNEILVMKESQHPNIVNFLDSFLVNGAELWVVMEFMEGGALTDIIDSNTLEEHQISCISNEVRPTLFLLFLTRLVLLCIVRLADLFCPPLDRRAKVYNISMLKASFTAILRATTCFSMAKDTSRLVRSSSLPRCVEHH